MDLVSSADSLSSVALADRKDAAKWMMQRVNSHWNRVFLRRKTGLRFDADGLEQIFKFYSN